MKYDSGMTQYHNDIVETIKAMISVDAGKVAELAAEGSPVPLREYLRDKHGKKITAATSLIMCRTLSLYASAVKTITMAIQSFSFPDPRLRYLSENILRRFSTIQRKKAI